MGIPMRLFVLAVLVVAYFFIFNLLCSIDFQVFKIDNPSTNGESISSPTSERVGMGDGVEVSVFRDGFFWNTETLSSENSKSSKIYLLGFIPLPLIKNNINFFWVHATASLIFFIGFLAAIFLNERGYALG